MKEMPLERFYRSGWANSYIKQVSLFSTKKHHLWYPTISMANILQRKWSHFNDSDKPFCIFTTHWGMKAKLFMPPKGQGYSHHWGKKEAPIINHYCGELAHKQLISQTTQFFLANLGNEEYWKSYWPAFCHARILFSCKFLDKIKYPGSWMRRLN